MGRFLRPPTGVIGGDAQEAAGDGQMDTLCHLLASLKRAYFTSAISQSRSEERNGVRSVTQYKRVWK